MVTVPTVSNVQQVGTARDPGLRVPASSGGAQIARTLGQAGETIGNVAMAFKRAEQAKMLNAATLDATKRLKEIEFELEATPDYQTYVEQFNQRADAVLSEFRGRIDDDTVFSAFQAKFAEQRIHSEFNLRKAAREEQVETGQAELLRETDTYQSLYAQAGSTEEQRLIAERARLAIAEAAEAGYIDRDAAVEMELKWLSDAEANHARELMLHDPERAVEALSDPRFFRDLDEGKRTTLLAQATARADTEARRQIAAQERAERAAERAMTAQQEQNFGVFYGRVIDGDIGLEDLDRALYRREIDGNQYARLRDTLETEIEPQDDPNVLVAMYDALEDGTLTKEQALTAFANGQISRERLDLFRNKIDQGLNEQQGLAARFVKDNVGGVTGPLAVLDAQSSIRVASAMREFHERTTGPDAEDPWKVADSVVKRFRPVEPDVTTLPKPLFMVGDIDTPEGIRASMQATVEAFQAGEITEEVFEQEADNLRQRERDLLERARRQKAAEEVNRRRD